MGLGDAILETNRSSVVAPLPESNELDALGQVSRQSVARSVLQAHRAGLQARRERDLLSEKLLLHIDGSGDLQWADILYGERIEIPRLVSEYRKTENLLRPIVDNAVAHHTTMPLRYFADSLPDREARDRAILDTLWVNHLAHVQDLNGLFAEALYMAMPAGFCPVHRYWRDDSVDQHEPISYGEASPDAQLRKLLNPQPGMIDCWVGNPFDTVFDRGAKRGSVHWCSYGRVLPAALVRQTFAHIPGAAGLEGSNRIPSAAQFQRIARYWRWEGLAAHGSPTITYRREVEEGEELIIVVCREILPGVDPDWPKGRLQIIAVPKAADLRRGEGSGSDHAVLLADQPLPAGDFSWTLFYSHHRGEDVHGKPWIEDMDQLQLDLNIALSKRWEFIQRMMEAPIVAPGGALSEDMMDIQGYNVMEIEPSLANWRPRVMEWPVEVLNALNRECDDRRRAMYTLGGYQAVSRGEAPGSRMAYRAILALQQADNTVHGPVNQRFRRSSVDFAVGCWRQMKTYGDVAWLIEIVGDEYAHLAEPYIDRTKLSEHPPRYKLVNAFGPSPELKAQEILELVVLRGADGQPFLRTDEARRQYPNSMIFDDGADPRIIQRRRAKAIATAFQHIAAQLRQQMQIQGDTFADPGVQQAAMQVFGIMETRYPRLRDDDLQAHLTALSEITQDETADVIARMAAQRRQDLYYQWQAMMAQTPGMSVGPGGAAQLPQAAGRSGLDPRAIAAQMAGQGAGGGVETGGPPGISATARG